MSLIKYCAAGNRPSKRYITTPESPEAESEDSIEVQISKRGPLFKTEQAKKPPKGVCFLFSILLMLLLYMPCYLILPANFRCYSTSTFKRAEGTTVKSPTTQDDGLPIFASSSGRRLCLRPMDDRVQNLFSSS